MFQATLQRRQRAAFNSLRAGADEHRCVVPFRFKFLIAALTLWAVPATARGQIFGANEYTGTIGEYTTTGATVNASLITGVGPPNGMALSGGNLFVNYVNNVEPSVAEYTTKGATVNASLIPGGNAAAIAVSGGNLFVAGIQTDRSYINEYTTSGSLVIPGLISIGGGVSAMAMSGGNLFVLSYNGVNDTIGEYTTSGATVNAALVTGLNDNPIGIAVSGGNLFVVNGNIGSISEYTTSGALVNAALVSGLTSPTYIAVLGGNLFVVDHGTTGIDTAGVVAEYTTSGATVNTALISFGVDGPIAVLAPVTTSWAGTASTTWAETSNWAGDMPGATGGTTSADTALFNRNAPNSPLTIDAGRNVQSLTFDTASVNSLTVGTVGGNALLLTAGGTIQTTPTVVNAQTVNAPLILEGDYTFTSGASSNSATLGFGGRITPGATSGVTTLTLNGANTGANTIRGILADNGAGQLAVTKGGSGLWILSAQAPIPAPPQSIPVSCELRTPAVPRRVTAR